MLQGEHSAIHSTFIKLPFVIKIFFCLFLSGHFTQVLLYYETLYAGNCPHMTEKNVDWDIKHQNKQI